ncbi:MAG: tetratricopeptide repeat protein [Thermoguttaceae bacterium]
MNYSAILSQNRIHQVVITWVFSCFSLLWLENLMTAQEIFGTSSKKLRPSHQESDLSELDLDAHKLLRSGDFSGALAAFQKELRKDATDTSLLMEYEFLRSVIERRKRLDEDIADSEWMLHAERLRTYYAKYQIHSEHVRIAQQIYQRSKTPVALNNLSRAFFAAQKYDEALLFFDEIDPIGKNISIQLEKAEFHLASGNMPDARDVIKRIAEHVSAQEDLLRLSRIQGAVRMYATSIKTLIRCFEVTHPKNLDKLKQKVFEYEEFHTIRATPEFILAMKTESTIKDQSTSCSTKWNGTLFDESPWYERPFIVHGLDLNDWKVGKPSLKTE